MPKYNSFLVSCIFFLFHVLLIKGQKPLAPALYVFGDSLVDSGNNNYLQTVARANYTPYGINFPLGATGRFTNGKTIADFIAKSLGLPFVPPYLSLSKGDKGKTTTGVNYASSGAGILPETGSTLGKLLSLDDQIHYFRETVTKDLPINFKSPAELSKYLAKAIFVISIGGNDYTFNYLQPANYNSSHQYNPQQFATLLVDRLQQRLMQVYKLGGRKFIVFGLGPLGCSPVFVNTANPRPTTPCVETVNGLLLMFNVRLPGMIKLLGSTLHGSTFVLGNSYQHSLDLNLHPFRFGFTGGRIPCCVLGGNGTCVPNQAPCKDASKRIYWDAIHVTEAAYSLVAKDCFSGSSTCFPINIQRLAQKH